MAKNFFNTTSKIKIPMSSFNLSHNQSGTFFPGYVYPVFSEKVLAGDTWEMGSLPFLRSHPMLSPLMTNVRVSFRYFYCRAKLLWKNFDEYITNKPRNNSTVGSSHVHPYLAGTLTSSQAQSVKDFYDWMYSVRFKSNNAPQPITDLDALPARMYNWIWCEYYANENLQHQVTVNDADGAETLNSYQLLPACYRKDYFTSGLPWPQRGDSIALPTSVILDNSKTQFWREAVVGGNFLNGADAIYADHHNSDLATTYMKHDNGVGVTDQVMNLDPNGSLATAIDIREFRQASAIQRFLERSAVNGNRYAEYLLAQYGVRIPDNSSYKPQYLGGGEQIVNFTPVEQTSETDTTPQGTLAGKGVLSGQTSMNHAYYFPEPGWIMCCMVIRPDADYVGGIPRNKIVSQDRLEDYPIPAFQNIGMQEVWKSEIDHQGFSGVNGEINREPFCYQERYAQFKTIPNQVHGEFLDSMNYWVAVRDMRGQQPLFNENFVTVSQNCLNNNMAVTKFAPFFGSIRHLIRTRRPLQFHSQYR